MRLQLIESPFHEEEKEERAEIWNSTSMTLEGVDPWMTLRPHQSLVDYRRILEEGGCDNESLRSFVGLVTSDYFGYMEGCRILAHFVKDSEQGFRHGPSQWLHRCTTEALEAIRNPEEWNKGASKGASSSSKGASSSSGPSTGWEQYRPLGQQEGKGKGKDEGKGKGRGFR